MKKSVLLILFLFTCSYTALAAESGKPVFGPVKYDVKERYGKDNRYQATFPASEGTYLIKIQNGDQLPQRSDFIELSVNGQKLLKDDKYEYRFIAGIVKLRKENALELVIKDARPAGFQRPALPPRFVTITVRPLTVKLAEGMYGLHAWEGLGAFSGLFQKMKSSESADLALSAVNLENDVAKRAEAMRKLSDRKDLSAQDFILLVFGDLLEKEDVRSEAALALGILGDKKMIPLLMQGILDPEEKVRIGSARALSFFKEEDTRAQLETTLGRLDAMRKTAVIRAIAVAGWKPVAPLLELAESPDPSVANTAVELLGSTGDARAVDRLLKYFETPGHRDLRIIITALGESRDRRALEPLSRMAGDPAKRAGHEGELGIALASLGDQKSVDVIVEMIKKAPSRQAYNQLRDAYKSLTGKDYK